MLNLEFTETETTRQVRGIYSVREYQINIYTRDYFIKTLKLIKKKFNCTWYLPTV